MIIVGMTDNKFPFNIASCEKIIREKEKRYEQLDEKVGSFPSMKVIIHCVLIKCEMNDLAKTITLPKSNSSQKLLEKLLKNNEDASE